MRLLRSAAGVDHVHTLWFARRQREIRVSHSAKKSPVFLFETIFVLRVAAFVHMISAARTLDAGVHVIVQKDGQIRLQAATENFVQLQHGL